MAAFRLAKPGEFYAGSAQMPAAWKPQDFTMWPRLGRSGDSPKNTEGIEMQVLVRDNNVEQAIRVLKKKLQREGHFRELRQRRAYEKPSERRIRREAEAVRRARKTMRKQAQREGLLPMPSKKAPPQRPSRPSA